MHRFAVALPMLLLLTAAPCWAATIQADTQDTGQLPNAADTKQQWTDAQAVLTKTSAVVGRFRSDPKMTALMRQARGVFVIPAFGHGSSPAAGAWGSAVLMANNNGQWSDAAFFTLGGGSLGPHVIANGGSLVLFIMNDRAMGKFESGTNWSLGSAPGTNIVTYSAATPQDLSGHGADIVAWSASGGANADTEVSITGVAIDTALNGTVYGTPDLRNILANRAPYINQDVIDLRREMPSTATAAAPAVQNKVLRHG